MGFVRRELGKRMSKHLVRYSKLSDAECHAQNGFAIVAGSLKIDSMSGYEPGIFLRLV